ncbi:hypothetical protein GCM10027589_54730 [Actinocorallia lasiicapitis]
MSEMPAGLLLCLIAVVITILVAAILPLWAYNHPARRRRRARHLRDTATPAETPAKERELVGTSRH